jgi:hypothetical protein
VNDVTGAVGGFRVAACLVVAGLALAVSMLETRILAVANTVDGMVDTINKQIYGEDYQTIRDAVTILVATMKRAERAGRSPDASWNASPGSRSGMTGRLGRPGGKRPAPRFAPKNTFEGVGMRV